MLGYDNLSLNYQILLDLPMRETAGGAGDYVFDRADPHHACLMHGATIGWVQIASGLWVMDFTAATPDWIDCPALDTADLDFTSGDFSIGVWLNPDALPGASSVFMRGWGNTDGWMSYVSNTGSLTFYTYQAGANQVSRGAADMVVIGTWSLIGISRSGASIRLYKNGVDNTNVAGDHTDPLTANRELHIGIHDNEVSSPYDGQIYRPRIWGRALTGGDWLELFNLERHWFGV